MSVKYFDHEKLKANIYLCRFFSDSNEICEYMNCDLPEAPFHSGYFSFWFENKLLSIPRERIAKIETYSHE